MSEKISVVQVGGSIEQAVKGDYAIDTKQVLSQAWQQTLKARVSINLGLGFSLILGMLVSYFASGYLGGIEAVFQDPQASMILNILVTVVIWPFMAGVEMMGVLHSIGMKTKPSMIFSFLKRGSWVAICALLTSSLISLGLQLLILPGIFLAVVLSLTIPLVVEKQLSPVKAIVISVQALRFKWFQLMTLYLVLIMCFLALLFPMALLVESSIAPVGVVIFLFGMTYLAPWYYNVKGILYRDIFGIQVASNNPEKVIENTANASQNIKKTQKDEQNSDDTFSA